MMDGPVSLAAPLRLPKVAFRSVRRCVRIVHLWLGLVIAAPMVVIGLSGSALILQRAILDASVPSAPAIGEVRPLAAIVAAAQAVMPPDIRANWITLPAAPGRPAAVRFDVSRRPLQTVEVYVDPVSLKVLGRSQPIQRGPLQRFLISLHGFLLIASPLGLSIVGWLGVAMTLMALSGLLLWWPHKRRWRDAFTVAKGAKGLRLHLDLHQVTGFWGLLVLLALSVSGVYLAFPQEISDWLRTVIPEGTQRAEPGVLNGSARWPADANEAAQSALAEVLDAKVIGIQLPRAGNDRYVVHMDARGFTPSFPPVTVVFDRDRPDVVSVDDPRGYTMANRALNTLYAVHLGLSMGWLWTWLIFLAGFLPLLLAVTGTTMWWRRQSLRRPAARRGN